MSIRRAVWQMKEAGWFSHVKGFLIGRPLCFGEEMFGLDHYRAVYDLLKEFDVPVLMDLDIGHLSPMMPLVCGAMAKVRTQGNSFQLEFDWR
jgi:muramoyltetrapeptide carboxypeptidase LdcA involved in peptidoglycan recycling